MVMHIRPLSLLDNANVLKLINLDRSPGQPEVTSEMLEGLLAGKSTIDQSFWDELKHIEVYVVVSRSILTGVFCTATHIESGEKYLLFLHAAEDPQVIDFILEFLIGKAGSSSIRAFEFATNLTVGMEALPSRRRSSTVQCLLRHGFVQQDLWSYMILVNPINVTTVADIKVISNNASEWTLSIDDGTQKLGQSDIGIIHGIGIIWFIEVDEPSRGHGHGRQLLRASIDVLIRHKAKEIILYVDDDGRETERDRARAKQLYCSEGFVEVDRLLSFLKTQ